MSAIGFVVADKAGTLSTRDTTFKGWLETDGGHTVTLISDEDAVPGGVDAYLISESVVPGTITTKYRDVTQGVVVCEVAIWDTEMRLAATAGATLAPTGQTVDLVGSHEIIAGLSDPLSVFTGNVGRYGVAAANLCSGAVQLAVHPSDPTYVMAWAVETGAALTTGTAAGRRVTLPYVDTSATFVTGGRDLFLNAIEWAAFVDAPPTDPIYTVWDGSTELAVASVTVWDGTTEQPIGAIEIAT